MKVPSNLTAAALAILGTLAGAPDQGLAYEHNIVRWPAHRFPLPIAMRPEGARSTPAEVLAEAVEASLTTWNRVPCSYARLVFDGLRDLPVQVDDRQVLAWVDDPDRWVYGAATAGATLIDVLGENGPRVDIVFNDVSFNWVVGASTFVTPDYRFGEDPPLDLDPQSVVTHEVGHLLGLAHPNPAVEGSEPDPLATMSYALLPGAQQRSLSGDDKIGLCVKYPVLADECGPGRECGPGERCRPYQADFGSVRLCDEVRDGMGAACGRDRYNCQGMCLFTSADFRQGFCTDRCGDGRDCPDDACRWSCRSVPVTTGGEMDVCWPRVRPCEALPDAGVAGDAEVASGDTAAPADGGSVTRPGGTGDTGNAGGSDGALPGDSGFATPRDSTTTDTLQWAGEGAPPPDAGARSAPPEDCGGCRSVGNAGEGGTVHVSPVLVLLLAAGADLSSGRGVRRRPSRRRGRGPHPCPARRG